MEAILTDSTFLEKTEFFVTKIATEEFSHKILYHDIEHIHRVVDATKEIAVAEGVEKAEKEIVLMAAWLSLVGLKNLDDFKNVNEPADLMRNTANYSFKISQQFLSELEYPENSKARVLKLIGKLPIDFIMDNDPDSHLANILDDAKMIDWSTPKAVDLSKKLYQEYLLTGADVTSESGWHDRSMNFLQNHQYLSTYGQEKLEPRKAEGIKWVEKRKKEFSKSQKAILKKELDISDDELKKLKKSLKSVKGRDEKGIQTMFRTTSRNHYTLNQMVDGKANIMISVNAIILSLILSRIIGQIETWCIHNSPVLIMLTTCSLSIVFAVLAIRPAKSHGEFTEQEIRNRQGNLLYFGNYHNMAFRDYQWGMLQMLNDGDNLYTTMIRDLYFLGQMLERKYKFLRYSLNVFMVGLVVAVFMFVIASSMPDYHIAGTH